MPIIGEKSAGGPEYLVNGNVILGFLEFLSKRGYGREPDPVIEENEHGGYIVVLHAPPPNREEFERLDGLRPRRKAIVVKALLSAD
jgi:hypothetical protein